jgi:hypothetical protein
MEKASKKVIRETYGRPVVFNKNRDNVSNLVFKGNNKDPNARMKDGRPVVEGKSRIDCNCYSMN